MKLKYAYIFLSTVLFLNCQKNNSFKLTNVKDYNKYLVVYENKAYKTAKQQKDFWNKKLQKSPSQYVYLSKIASANNKLFSAKGSINHLISAEKNLIEINEKTKYNNAANLRALARNYISQHRFKEALSLLLKAEENGEKLNFTQKMLFDVYLELGNEDKASHYLSLIRNLSDFDYLIRISKWSDYKGNLSSAINFLEKATKIAESSNNKELKIWSYTNLADFYGHNNEVKKSYKLYLKSLELQPDNAYAKKGIAWILYSYERNPKEALRILNLITEEYQSPDYYLLKAEIAEFMQNEEEKNKNIKKYKILASNNLYGDMYNQYNIKLFLEEENTINDAFNLIEKEINNRATPESYDLLAWAFYKKGAYKKALEISEKHVVNKTFEPEAQYHIAQIYKANNLIREAEMIKQELLESAYELGPLTTKKIQKI